MAQSLVRNLMHIIFSTKNRKPLIIPSVREELKAYLIGTLRNFESPSVETNCVDNHVHILCSVSRKIVLMTLLEKLKKTSSKWIKSKGPALQGFYWQAGHGGFSVSPSNVPAVCEYIRQQDAHHRTMTFEDEYRAFLRKHGIAFDERYVWD